MVGVVARRRAVEESNTVTDLAKAQTMSLIAKEIRVDYITKLHRARPKIVALISTRSSSVPTVCVSKKHSFVMEIIIVSTTTTKADIDVKRTFDLGIT